MARVCCVWGALILGVLLVSGRPAPGEVAEGRFAGALRSSPALGSGPMAEPKPDYNAWPLTVECWAYPQDRLQHPDRQRAQVLAYPLGVIHLRRQRPLTSTSLAMPAEVIPSATWPTAGTICLVRTRPRALYVDASWSPRPPSPQWHSRASRARSPSGHWPRAAWGAMATWTRCASPTWPAQYPRAQRTFTPMAPPPCGTSTAWRPPRRCLALATGCPASPWYCRRRGR